MFTTKKQIIDYFSGDKIECLLCGRLLKSIGGQHLKSHGTTVLKYKKNFGLPMGLGLVSEKTRETQRISLLKRIHEKKELSLQMTPDRMKKAQQSHKKNGFPKYHLAEMKKYSKNGIIKIKERADKIMGKIDWDLFLEEVKKTGLAISSVSKNENMPTATIFYRKKNNDPAFSKKYDQIIKDLTKYSLLSKNVIKLTQYGMSQRQISKILPISKTHIARIQKRKV